MFDSKVGGAVALSEDHKPDNGIEAARIRQAGHFVMGGRVDGNLAVSRGLGDFGYKDKPSLGVKV
jgi:protein phosphatase PTC2/3